MANEIKKGAIISLTSMKTGKTKEEKAWALVPTKDEKDRNPIALWIDNAEEASSWVAGKIVEILSVKHGVKKYQEKWYPQIDVSVKLEKADGADVGFMQVDNSDIDDIFG